MQYLLALECRITLWSYASHHAGHPGERVRTESQTSGSHDSENRTRKIRRPERTSFSWRTIYKSGLRAFTPRRARRQWARCREGLQAASQPTPATHDESSHRLILSPASRSIFSVPVRSCTTNSGSAWHLVGVVAGTVMAWLSARDAYIGILYHARSCPAPDVLAGGLVACCPKAASPMNRGRW